MEAFRMRKFEKLISYLIAAVIMLCLLPSDQAFAARGKVRLGEKSTTTAEEIVIDIGETKDLNPYGATGYVYKTDINTLHWTTSNSNVVTVDPKKGIITGVSAGTAKVSVMLTVAKTRTSFEGSINVIVNKKNETQVQLYSYDRVKLVFPTAEMAATALKNRISVEQIRYYGNGQEYTFSVVPTVTIDNENKNILWLESSSYINGGTYQFKGTGLPEGGIRKVLSWELKAHHASLRYENNTMSTAGGWDITGSRLLSYCDATPVFELYDSNNIVIGRVENGSVYAATSGLSGNLKFVKKEAVGNCSLRSVSTGVVRLNKMDQSMVVQAVWTSSDRSTTIESNDVVVVPEEYVRPTFDLAEGIVVTSKTGNDINWKGSEDWVGSMPATTTKSVLFYFVGSDGKKYSPCRNVYTNSTDINPLSSDYRYIWVLDDSSKNTATITTSNGMLHAYSEGVVSVYIYQCETGRSYYTPGSTLVGQFTINVTEAPYLGSIDIDESYQIITLPGTGTPTPTSIPVSFQFKTYDQYGEPYTMSDSEKGSLNAFVISDYTNPAILTWSKSWDANSQGGKLITNMLNKPLGEYKFDVKCTTIINGRQEQMWGPWIEIDIRQ